MTIPDRIKIPTAFWIGVDRLNIGRSALIRSASLPLAVGVEGALVTTFQFFQLWRALEALAGSEVGLFLTQALDGAVMPPSFLVAYHARDFGDALQRVARFKSLCAPEQLTISSIDEACVIDTHWPHGGVDVPASLIDATMASLVGLARTGADECFQPLRLELRRNRNATVAAHFGCPIQWNAPKDRLFLRKSDLALQFQTYNAELVGMLDAALTATREKQDKATSLSEQVQWLLRRSMTAGRPEMRSVARELAISERSLQRRLNEEGQTFQCLLSTTRHELACEYLLDRSLEISEIAYMLGYDDSGSFYRAFQKWEHQTPSEWRGQRSES